jgi:microfibrillar-associated protein 1
MNAFRDSRILNINRKEENKAQTINTNQLVRYRAGIKPEWIDENSSDEDIFKDESLVKEIKPNFKEKKEMNRKIELNNEIIQQIESTDRRLQRLAQNKNKVDIDKQEIDQRIKRRREIFKSEIIQSDEKHHEININEKELKTSQKEKEILEKTLTAVDNKNHTQADQKRKKVLTKVEYNNENEDELIQLLEEAKKSENPANELDNDNNEEEIYQSFEEAEEEILMRPVFISKEERRTIQDNIQKEIEEQELIEQEEKTKDNRKKQTVELVNSYIEKENEKDSIKEKDSANNKMPDDTDNLDDLEEYEKWKLRELRRIKRQVEEDEIKLKEKLEIERRRKLTNEQRKEENLRLGSDDTLRPFKSKINFLQRFYHKGSFFQHESQGNLDHIFNRDYNMPIAEEKRDLSVLPQILQKRRGNLFKKGQSKYSHLTAEDTTCFDPNYKIPDNIVNKMLDNLGGYKAKDNFELKRNKNK